MILVTEILSVIKIKNIINFKTITFLLLFVTSLSYSQDKTGYYINWDIDHTEKSVRPSLRISEEESKIVNCYLVKFDKQNRLISTKYYFSGTPSNYGNYGAFELTRTYQDNNFVEKYKNIHGEFVSNSSDITKRKYTLNKSGYWVKKEISMTRNW